MLKSGHRLMAPGRFVRIRLPIGEPHRALLVIDRAIASDHEGQKYVYVLDAEDKVQSRRITTGALQPDGLRAVEEGLEAGRLGLERRNLADPAGWEDQTGTGADADARPSRPGCSTVGSARLVGVAGSR